MIKNHIFKKYFSLSVFDFFSHHDIISLSPGSEPVFQSVFSSQLLHPGTPLSLKCSATGDPMPQIRWFLYDLPLTDHHDSFDPFDENLMSGDGRKRRFRIGDFLDSHGTIISYVNVSTISSHDGGLYTCQAYSDTGGSLYHSALIQVYGPPSIHPMDNVTIVTGNKLQVDCPYSGYPVKDVRWKKGSLDTFVSSRTMFSFYSKSLSLSFRFIHFHLRERGMWKVLSLSL